MISALAFVMLAGCGALVRAETGRRLNRHDGFPLGTLVVNVVGSFALGTIHTLSPPAATVLGVAGLGALTTFSSFARDVAALVEVHRAALAALYVTVTVVAGVGAAWLGIHVA